jgi:hypothetical protein
MEAETVCQTLPFLLDLTGQSPEEICHNGYLNIRVIIFIIFFWTANGFVPGGGDTAIRHNTQNNTPHTK